jgi:hypothetical protein
MSEEKIKEKKKWQPVNIILGLLILSTNFYFFKSLPPPIFLLYIPPAIILILTRKNNFFSFLILFAVGLTASLIITFDGFLILGSAVYMFFSTILLPSSFRIHWTDSMCSTDPIYVSGLSRICCLSVFCWYLFAKIVSFAFIALIS